MPTPALPPRPRPAPGAALLAALLLFVGLFAPGCWSPAEAPAPAASAAPTTPDMTLDEFARRYRLTRLSSVANRYEFDADGRRLIVFPHLAAVNFAGQAYPTPEPPRWRAGELVLPGAFVAALPATLRERADGVVAAPAPMTSAPLVSAPGAPAPAAAPAKRRLVIIDAGHGGHDAGAIANGLREKDVALDVATRLRAALAARGVNAVLTRDRDVFLTLDERSRIANRHSGAVFLSVHLNSAKNRSASGVETFWISGAVNDDARARAAASRYAFIGRDGRLSRAAATAKAKAIAAAMRRDSQALAATVQAALARDLGEIDRGVKQANFAVLRENFFGAVALAEVGFLTHAPTARKLATPAYRQRVADSLARAIVVHLGG